MVMVIRPRCFDTRMMCTIQRTPTSCSCMVRRLPSGPSTMVPAHPPMHTTPRLLMQSCSRTTKYSSNKLSPLTRVCRRSAPASIFRQKSSMTLCHCLSIRSCCVKDQYTSSHQSIGSRGRWTSRQPLMVAYLPNQVSRDHRCQILHCPISHRSTHITLHWHITRRPTIPIILPTTCQVINQLATIVTLNFDASHTDHERTQKYTAADSHHIHTVIDSRKGRRRYRCNNLRRTLGFSATSMHWS